MGNGFGSNITRIIALITVLFTTLSALFGVLGRVEYSDWPSVEVGIEERGDGVQLRVMSFNIRCTNVGTEQWYDRVDIVSRTIIDSKADSVGVQEATPQWMSSLSETLNDYDYVGVGRDNGDNLGEYSAVFYLKDKYNVVDSGTFWLSETPDKPSYGWDAACRRVCTWVILENKQTGDKYMHMNSHFDHIGIEARENSVNMISSFAAEHSDIPVVFTADMNVRQGSDNYNQITSGGVLSDTKFLAADTMDYLTFHDCSPSTHAGSVIDYVMVNSHFLPQTYKVVTAGYDGRYVSDHFPIYCDMTFA